MIIIAVLLIATEMAYFRIADRFDIIDKPNLRSSHTHITLRGGGVVFLAAAWIYTLFFGLKYPYFMAGLTAICAVSFMDDVRSVPNRIRLIVHFAAMLLMFYQWGIVSSEAWWQIIPALILCTGIINAYNFMDGINGITGGYALAAIWPLAVANRQWEFIDEKFLAVVSLSIIVFCFFNFRKRAKCFAGDVGSVGIAFIILFALGALVIRTGQLWYIVFLAVYGVDTVLTICHRIMLHENIFNAHRKHAYQLLANELHIPHTTVAASYAAIQSAISAGALWLPMNKWAYTVSAIVVLSAAYMMLMRKYYHLHEEWLRAQMSEKI